jgi:hypothetical protein
MTFDRCEDPSRFDQKSAGKLLGAKKKFPKNPDTGLRETIRPSIDSKLSIVAQLNAPQTKEYTVLPLNGRTKAKLENRIALSFCLSHKNTCSNMDPEISSIREF